MKTIAVLGTGHMGAPIARRLLAAPYPVIVWNRTAARAAELAGAGARVADSPADAARDADVVITMLTDADAVDAALFGAAGAAPALRPGTCVVQMSTIAPAQVRALAARLPAGVDLIDAPVAGSVAAAAAGGLTVLAGGESAALDRVAPVLATLGTVRRCGPVGAGAALKLVLNTALVTAFAALADTLAVADAAGVDRDAALAALMAGPLGGAVTRATATGTRFRVALAAKDARLALAELGAAPAPALRAAAQTLSTVVDQDADLGAIIPQRSTP
ncbi:NAD(P)-dependent oxidoreductase [Phytohabitans rumicis]|uniref:NAD(P)-dependent oxidoreductase n=1 Tax=Phytohabitans rumicis TaxID=1076125 RepID=UPI0015676CBF|nr:NAD(P)-dependent oxidoreductase [Phytohabitans rumicis]